MATFITVAVLLMVVWIPGIGIYRTFFHTASRFPGPRFWGISQICIAYNFVCGRLPYRISELHKKYGPVVRIAPNEISYTKLAAWHDIYGRPKGGKELQKHHTFVPPSTGISGLIFEIDDVEHRRLRFVPQSLHQHV